MLPSVEAGGGDGRGQSRHLQCLLLLSPSPQVHMRCCSPAARFILLQFLSLPGAKQTQRCSLDRSAQTRPTRPARPLGNHIHRVRGGMKIICSLGMRITNLRMRLQLRISFPAFSPKPKHFLKFLAARCPPLWWCRPVVRKPQQAEPPRAYEGEVAGLQPQSCSSARSGKSLGICISTELPGAAGAAGPGAAP